MRRSRAKALGGKTNASNGGEERDEEETEKIKKKKKKKTERREGRLKREEKVSTSRATFMPFTSVPAIDEEQGEGREVDEEGRGGEKAEHTKVKLLRFTGDFMA